MNYKLLGSRVREQRMKKGITQEQLAELCNISSSYIGIIERGDKKLSVETLVKVANTLNVSTDYLLLDSLQLTPDARTGELASAINGLKPDEVNMVLDVVKTLASHLK